MVVGEEEEHEVVTNSVVAKISRKFVVLLDNNVSKKPKSSDHFLKVSVRVVALFKVVGAFWFFGHIII